jgi:hypothetical protein
MPSRALGIWESTQRAELDRLEAARGRGAVAQPISDACIVVLAAHFQAFCRELHTEAAEAIAASTPHADLVKKAFVLGRQLDRGNATPGAVGADFGRLGIDLWAALKRWDWRTPARAAARAAQRLAQRYRAPRLPAVGVGACDGRRDAAVARVRAVLSRLLPGAGEAVRGGRRDAPVGSAGPPALVILPCA